MPLNGFRNVLVNLIFFQIGPEFLHHLQTLVNLDRPNHASKNPCFLQIPCLIRIYSVIMSYANIRFPEGSYLHMRLSQRRRM